AGGQLIAGGCVSLTAMVKAQLDELFAASVTVHVTVVTPFGNALPDAGVQVGAPRFGQPSLTAGAAYVITAVQRFGSVPLVMLAGQVRLGFCVSFTVTVNVQ